MSPAMSQIDDKLDEWGSRLFNVSTETLPRPRSSKHVRLSSSRFVSTGGRLSTPQARATYVRQKLQAMVRRSPQVVVKLVRAPKGMKGISNNLTYISRDGRLDIMVANYVDFDVSTAPLPGQGTSCVWKGIPVMCGPRGLKHAANTLYHNRGDGTFEDVSVKSGIAKTGGFYSLSVSTFDFDNDGWPDIYVACDSTPSILYHNNRDGTFTDVAVVAGAAYNEDGREQAGMGSTIADYDGDGRLDIFKTNFSDDTSTLYRNNGDGTFTDMTFSAGLGMRTKYLGWGTMFLDIDNDGWPDILLVNGHVYPEVDKHHLGADYEEPRILYRNNGNGTFTDISDSSGTGITARSAARGLAVGDLWNDGRISAVVSNMNARPSLLVNQVRSLNHWMAFKTVGTHSNRDGIGAKITLKVGKRTLVDEVRSGSSYESQSDMRVHFGLGGNTHVDSVDVRWPNGTVERFGKLKLDAINTLTEGAGATVEPDGKKAAAPINSRP